MPEVLIALGSNVGDRLSHLRSAVQVLSQSVEILSAAAIYETAPMYVEEQGSFLNSAVLAKSSAGPMDLLRVLKEAESEIGRRQERRYGPREIDIDLISYGVMRYRFTDADGVRLEVPHSKVAERRFVLAPLFDLLPDGRLPGVGEIADLLDRTKEQASCVLKLNDALLPVHSHR